MEDDLVRAMSSDTLRAVTSQASIPTGGPCWFEALGVDERLIHEALSGAMERGGDFADLFLQHRLTSHFVLEDGSVSRAYKMVELGAGLRVVKGDQVGFAFTEVLTRAALLEVARVAAVIADGPPQAVPAPARVPAPAPSRYPVQVPWETVSPAAKIRMLDDLNARAFAAHPGIRKVTLTFADQEGSILVADSSGRLVVDSQPMTSLAITCVAERDGQREWNSQNLAARADISFYTPARLSALIEQVVARTLILFEAAPAPPGEMPVVLAAGPSGILLHEAIGHGLEADFNRKGLSIYADRLQRRIAAPFVTIVDDGTQPGCRGAINIDDEGEPAQRTVLVQDGVLVSYLHDRISARHYRTAPTGNGRRESYQSAPLPRMRSTYMLGGPHEREEILRSVKRGLYCEGFANGQVQIGAGDFTFYVKNGYLIEDGRLTRPVKDVNVIGNGPKALELVDMVAADLVMDQGAWTCGKEGQNVPVSLGIPTLRVSSLTVGGQETD